VPHFLDDGARVTGDAQYVLDIFNEVDISFNDFAVFARDFAVYFLSLYAEFDYASIFINDLSRVVPGIVNVKEFFVFIFDSLERNH
jgi:hypothetical protein